MSHSPELISLGERVMHAGFSFFWVHGKNPCFVSHGGRYIIIVDIDGVLPVWSPDLDESSELLGSSSFATTSTGTSVGSMLMLAARW